MKRILGLTLFGGILLMAVVCQLDYASFNLSFIGRRTKEVNKSFVKGAGTLVAYVDNLEITDEFVRIEGWAKITDRSSRREQVYIFLKNETDSIMISALPLERPDVSDAMSWRFRFSGYKIYYPVCRIPEGQYRLGIMIEGGSHTEGLWTDKYVNIGKNTSTVNHCDSLVSLQIEDNISLRRHYFREIGSFLPDVGVVGYASDTLPYPFNEIRAGEVAYSIVPHVLAKGYKDGVLVGFFPVTRTLDNPDNPLYRHRKKYRLLKDFGNGVVVLQNVP